MTTSTASPIQLAALTLSGLLAGNELGTLIGFHPALRRLPLRAEIESEQALTGHLMKIMPFYTSATLAAAIAAAIERKGSPGFRPSLVAAAATAGMLAITAVGNIPLNERTMGYSPAGEARDWRDIRRRWERLHAGRVLLDLTAFGSLAAAALKGSAAKAGSGH